MDIKSGPDNLWYADVPLSPDGSPRSLRAGFEDGALAQDHAISWSATNIASGGRITLRDGDSLRLTSFPGASPDNGSVTITGPGISLATTADAPVALPFFAGRNHALASNGATASQSSTYSASYPASHAIDGYPSSAGFTHTENFQDSWWQVDFGQDCFVGRVVLHNRDSYQDRLSNFRIAVLDANGVELSAQDFFTTSGNVGSSMTWTLPTPVTGRFVRVSVLGWNLPGYGYLSLAEVQAFPPDELTLTATHTDGNGAVTHSNMNVKVVSANFGPDLSVRSDRWRDWQTAVPDTLQLQADARIKYSPLSSVFDNYRLRISTEADKKVRLLARTEPGGSIAARGTLDPFLIGDAYDSGYVEVLDTLPNGTIVGRLSIVADRLPPGGYVEIQIWAGGAQFANGTSVIRLYASSFDANGQAVVTVYYPSEAAISSFCAYYRLYDGNGVMLSAY